MTVADVLQALDAIAPRALALPDDPGGLLVGDPAAEVKRIAVVLDVTRGVAETAASRAAHLIVAHHPLVYHPLRSVRADDPIGAVVLACARANIAVAAAHTNWDVAPGGVNDVLAELLGVTGTRPLRVTYRESSVKIVAFVPPEHRDRVQAAMAEAGAGVVGNYDRCAFWTPGVGTFRPLPGANPYLGSVGEPERVAEDRLEMIAPEAEWPAVVAALRAAHPYEEPGANVYPLADPANEQGIGRVGRLAAPLAAEAFCQRVRDALHFDAVRMVGPRERRVQTVAVCGGAGAFLMRDALAAGADAFVTADVRHHEFVEAEARGLLLLDAGHASTETPGARELARRLDEALAPGGVETIFLD